MSRQLLRDNPGFGRLMAGQVPSDFADWLSYVAITTLMAFHWDAPPVAFAWFAVALGLPYLTVGLLAGVIVDRLPIRMVLIVSNLARGAVFFAMMLAGDWVTLLGLLVLGQTVDSFFTPAKQAALQSLVRHADRMAANGISHAVNSASKVAGPALGGALLTFAAPGAVFAITGTVSLVAALILLTLPALTRTKTAERQTLFGGLRAGIAIAWGAPRLRAALGIMAATFFAIFLFDTLIAPLMRDLGYPQTAMGWTLAAFGGGGVAGAIWLSRTERAPFRLIAAGALVNGVLLIVPGAAEMTGTSLPLVPLLMAFVLGGVTSAMVLVPPRVVIQAETDETSIARVTSLAEALNTLALISAPFLGAWLAAQVSTGLAFVVGGLLMFLVGLVAWGLSKRDETRAGPGQAGDG